MKTEQERLDDVYDGIDSLMQRGNWSFLDNILKDLTPKIWRLDLDIVLGYATATFPGKSKLPNRKAFMDECIRRYPDSDLWQGLID